MDATDSGQGCAGYAPRMTYRAVTSGSDQLEATLNHLGDAGWTIVSVAGNHQSYLLGGAGAPSSYLIVCQGDGELPNGIEPLAQVPDQAW